MSQVRLFGPERSQLPVIPWNSRLDGVTVRFRLQYIERCDRWDLRIGLQDGSLIAAGQRIVLGFDMFKPYNDSRLPNGELFVIDSQAKYDELPGRTGWRERFWFLYRTKPEPVDDRDLRSTLFVPPQIPQEPQ